MLAPLGKWELRFLGTNPAVSYRLFRPTQEILTKDQVRPRQQSGCYVIISESLLEGCRAKGCGDPLLALLNHFCRYKSPLLLFCFRCELFDQNLKLALEVAEKAGPFGPGS